MSDKIYISGSTEDIENKYYLLPSEYDNGYMHSTTPYHFQNLINSIVPANNDTINSEIRQGIEGQNINDLLRWFKVINTEDYPLDQHESEFNATFEKDYARKFGNWINDNFKYSNRDLLINYNVSPAMMRYYGYDEDDDHWSVLYPQFGLFWNTNYNKYFGIWYTPILPSGAIIEKTAATSYIESLRNTANYYKNDVNSIILRVDTELGFTVFDIQKLSIGISSERVVTKLTDLKNWCNALTEVQVYYQLLVENSDNRELLENYIFIDEDKSIFNTVRKNYFLFKIEPINYFNDLEENINYQELDYWDAGKDYNAGDIVLGSINSDTMKKNYIYRCVHSHTHTGTFDLIVPIEVITSTGEKGIDYTIQWEYITNEYAKELSAIEDAVTATGVTFNKNNYIRFVIPSLEDFRPVEYYTNGDVKPNQQQGLIAWSDSEGYTLRQVTHVRLDPQYFIEHSGDNTYPTPEIALTYRQAWSSSNPTPEQLAFIEEWKEKINKIPKIYYKDYKNICRVRWSNEPLDENSIYDWDLVEPKDDYLVEQEKWRYQLDDSYSSPTSSSVASMTTNGKIVHYFKKSTLSKNGTLVPTAIQAKLMSIKDEAFLGRKELLKVVLRSSVVRIGSKAFSNCPNLYQVILPKNLKVLGLNAFSACISLKRATIPRNVTVLNGTYAGCINLESVVLSEKCVEIGTATFTNCFNLKKVYNTQKIQTIGDNAFNGCGELLDFTISKDVTVLPDRAFKGCRKCKFDISAVRNSIEYLGEGCFQDCEQLEEAISFENITTLYPNSYKNCKKLTSIVFNLKPINYEDREDGPDGSKLNAYIIPSNFCYGCSGLMTINLNNIEQLNDSCFENCSSLTSVTIPTTVNLIGKRIFYDCFQMGTLTVPTFYTEAGTNIVSSWIEKVLTPENKNNWVDRVYTKVYNGNGVELHW